VTTNPVAAYFDGVADHYDQVLPFFAGFARQVAEVVRLPPDAQVLDLAAGRGALSAEFAGRAGRLVAVDAAPRMIELLARDLPGVETHVMDAARLEFPDASFDVVLAGFVVHILTDPVACTAEVKRVLRPGGQFAFTIPGRADGKPDPWTDPLAGLFAEYRDHQAGGAGLAHNGADEQELLDQAGFTDVTLRTLEIAIGVPDGETYWNFTRSHGVGAFINGLPDDKRAEFRGRLIATVAASGGFTLRRSATLVLARRP
jgi:ubiquinone/menaquinone biosynthesis C-methylase UbiE